MLPKSEILSKLMQKQIIESWNLFRKSFIPWKDGQILAFALKKSEKKEKKIKIKVMKAVIEWLLFLLSEIRNRMSEQRTILKLFLLYYIRVLRLTTYCFWFSSFQRRERWQLKMIFYLFMRNLTTARGSISYLSTMITFLS